MAIGLCWIAAVAAQAGPVAGTGLVVGKDVAARTVVLDGGRLLHVPQDAVLSGADGERLSLADLAVAEAVGGGFRADGFAMVRFEGDSDGAAIRVRRLQVLGAVVQ